MATNDPRTYSISTKNWSFDWLLKQGPRFMAVPRVSALEHYAMLKRIKQYEADGIPLVIEHWNRHQSWNSTIFSLDWLMSNMGDECMTSNVLRSMISYSQLL